MNEMMNLLIDQANKTLSDIYDREIDYISAKIFRERNKKIKKLFFKKVLYRLRDSVNEKIIKENGVLGSLEIMTLKEYLNFIVEFHLFFTEGYSEDEIVKIYKDETYINKLIYYCTCNIYSSFLFPYQVQIKHKTYNPLTCQYIIYIEFILEAINNIIKLHKKVEEVVIPVLIHRGLEQLHNCIISIDNKKENDALILWRSVFELECIIEILWKNDNSVVAEFLSFSEFTRVVLEVDSSKIKEIKDKLKVKVEEADCKYKNLVQFRNYGWLLSIPKFKESKKKLTFKEGILSQAGLEKRYRDYEIACTVSHPTSLTFTYVRETMEKYVYEKVFESCQHLSIIYLKYFCNNEEQNKIIRENWNAIIELQDIYRKQHSIIANK